jgi:hypothetical protein
MTDPTDAARWNKCKARHRKAAHRARINGSSGPTGACLKIDVMSGEVVGEIEADLNAPARADPASQPQSRGTRRRPRPAPCPVQRPAQEARV